LGEEITNIHIISGIIVIVGLILANARRKTLNANANAERNA
jgi:drug/metabolite transporter (DMT)-like permease